jgi:sugar fermentation stimulation protein A
VLLSHHPLPHRKLKWTLELIFADNCWVGVNTLKTNKIVEEAITCGKILQLKGYDTIKREVAFGHKSRVDFMLTGKAGRCYVEVKNVTYKKNELALFPDAVTQRGKKHLTELLKMKKKGYRAVIFYLVNRDDCTFMSIAENIDSAYAQGLKDAIKGGVEAIAYSVKNTITETILSRELKILI